MTENLFQENSIRTNTGKYINFLEPEKSTFEIDDIAHALSQIPRFGGHLPVFYSVAQHCVLGSELIDQKHAYNFLMHDASEAYLLDIPKPLKELLPEYKKIEQKFTYELGKAFRLRLEMSDEVKIMDHMMLQIEWSLLMLEKNESIGITIDPWPQEKAKKKFLMRYHELSAKKCLNYLYT